MAKSTRAARAARATNLLFNSAKFIILSVRKYRFLGIGYLIIFIWLVFSASQPRPQANQIANSENYYSNSNPISIVANTANAKAYKSGNEVTVRWDKPIFDARFRADNRRIAPDNISCQLDFCVIHLSQKASLLKAKWTENGELFSKEFSFNQ